jgi:molybdopterin-dependent oxidoreductase alpha subunit
LVDPVIYTRETGRYTPISWDDACRRIANKLVAIAPEESFWYFSGRSSNEAGFLLQLFARLYGTNNVNNCSFYCHQASGVGLSSVTGSGTATIEFEDLEQADTMFVIGGNPASNHPRLMTVLKNIRRRRGEVIVVNPIVETGMVNFSIPSDPWSLLFGCPIASLYVQPHIGGDLAMLYGIMKSLVEMKAYDQAFLETATIGWAELRRHIEQLGWDDILAKSGVSRKQIEDMARRYAKSERTVFSWTMGITHHAHGVMNVQAIATLALMRGMVGKPGAGLLPIRGHSNVQGIGSMGVTPQLKQSVFNNIEQHLQIQLPTKPGLDTMACIEGADRGELKFGLCLGGNLYGSNPDSKFAEQALAKLDQLVYLSTTLNTGHAIGLARETIILPVLARDEEPYATTQESMFNYVRLSDGGPRRLAGPRGEVEVIADLAERVASHAQRDDESSLQARRLSALDWTSLRDTGHIRTAIARIVPGYEKVGAIDATKTEFQIAGRTFHSPRFATDSGLAMLHTHELPRLVGESDELRLMTIRSEGQFNTVVYEDDDLYRNVKGRDVILMHPEDLATRGLGDGELLTVFGPAGWLGRVRAVAFAEIRAGNAAMYYPEANVLVGRELDPASKTPAFKCVPVRVQRWVEQASSLPVVANLH